MALDFQGNIVSIIQIIALILLIIGVYPYRIRTQNRNLIMHGFLSILALALNLATVIWVMLPTFTSSISEIAGLSILQATIIWLHAGYGGGCGPVGFRHHCFVGYASFRRTRMLQNVATDASHLSGLGACIGAGVNYTCVQHSMTA